jgi:hypothetical protein
MIVTHNITHIGFENNILCLTIDNKEYRIPLEKISARLLQANERERNAWKLSPSGYGIHWPLIDEDLAVDGLMKIGV